ncbi:hypothetical protein [Estrella lausannensis]|uniref:Uncharacterized protein n=1 Tax=Estrella lausannensis TaxID=483423 RepID=A0A0H5DQT4_9BACT|nr:hypothetical protein [Estrella lausannensis]CRX39021.1 hypothetical protein ELAC_1694 [Estrella lausannensis]
MTDLNAEYIYVQVCYAKKWRELGLLSFEEALRVKTCVFKLLFGGSAKAEPIPAEWSAIAKELEKEDPWKAAAAVVQLKKSGMLAPPKKSGRKYSRYFGPFRYSYEADRQELSIHFTIKGDGEGVIHWREGKDDLTALFKEVKEKLPDAKVLKVESTLMFNTFWKRMCPPEFFQRFIPATEDDSILRRETPWSQFIDFQGRPKKKTIQEFLTNLSHARNSVDLSEAFPILPRRSYLELDVIYRFYGV